ncbi:Transposase [Caligus rogercresseyi]|uniref:Transposase n=1 Tax=Caligus rogercresseyi TaxID=217165 RepID=A0A7T8KCS8_CALRO|nr:Transposase [Caligus rogercresseyi]
METPDFRSYFLIRIKLARTVNEIHGDLLSTFPDSWPGLSTLQRWHTEFDKGVFALEKKTRPGRPRETRTEENVARVKRLVDDNPRMTTRQVAAELSVANKTQRVKCCQDLLKLFQDHREDFLEFHLLVQDESWFYWDSAERRQVWAEPTGARISTPRVKQTARKTMIQMGFTCKPRRVSITALPAGTAADRNTMIEYLRTTGKRFLCLKKDKIRLKDCLLMWDNSRPHTATDTREFLTWRDVEPVKQSPYSPT